MPGGREYLQFQSNPVPAGGEISQLFNGKVNIICLKKCKKSTRFKNMLMPSTYHLYMFKKSKKIDINFWHCKCHNCRRAIVERARSSAPAMGVSFLDEMNTLNVAFLKSVDLTTYKMYNVMYIYNR